jgi:hypothetical protein
MRELAKVLCVVILLFRAPLAAVAWFDDKLDFPKPVIYFLMFGCPILCALAVGLFLKIHFRADEVPDYLGPRVGTYFNRDGFCVGILPAVADGVCVFEVYFQNQYENRSVGRFAVRPARRFFLGRAKMESIIVEVDCEPAAFGVARVAVPLPAMLQGRRQSFEVGASVEYPEGKGRRLRFGNGITLRANSSFGNAFGVGLTVAGALTGQIVYTSPATVTIDLPKGVAEDVTDRVRPTPVDTLWKLGAPPMAAVGARTTRSS